MDEKRRKHPTTTITKLRKVTRFDGSATNSSAEVRAFLDVHVHRIDRWIEYDHGNRIFGETRVGPPITLQCPLEIQSLSEKMYLQGELEKLITEDIIDRGFWDEFIETVLFNFQILVESATEKKSGEIILSVEVVVVNEKPFNEKRFLEYISDRSIMLELDSDDDDNVESLQRVLHALRTKRDIVETMTFKKYVSRGGSFRGECTICLKEILEGEKILKIPCSHLFHCECVTEWLKRKNTCPLCRYELKKARRSHRNDTM